jgi:prepilin-type N-terminal cleavage/methylation domain-containing protein
MNRRRMEGFTLVELLVALLIFSLAIIGYASLNNRLVVAQWSQQQRAEADQAVELMAERIKINHAARGCYPLLAGRLVVAEAVAAGGVGSCTGYGTLTSQAAVSEDIADWLALLAGRRQQVDGAPLPMLPEAMGCVEELTAQQRYRVTVIWRVAGSIDKAPSHCQPLVSDGSGYLSASVLVDFPVLAE